MTGAAGAGRGARNLITDVAGLRVGCAHDAAVMTGVTVILPDAPTTFGVDVRGGGPGTRETDAGDPTGLVARVHGLVLAGGSVFGLAAADAVVARLSAAGVGVLPSAAAIRVGASPSPVVPAAILYDLANGGDKSWGGADGAGAPPYARLGAEAYEAAAAEFPLGNAGAGYGALAGAYKGGLGSASLRVEVGADAAFTVGALVAANPVGSPVMPGADGALWAHPFEIADEFGGRRPRFDAPPAEAEAAASAGTLAAGAPVAGGWPADAKFSPAAGANTTLAVVAVDAELGRGEARRLAIMAHDGLARAIRPLHTPFDGDVVFALATGARPLCAEPTAARAPEPGDQTAALARAAALAQIGAAAADCLARAVGRAMYEASSIGAHRCWRAVYGVRTG